jgi:hypothetical protein
MATGRKPFSTEKKLETIDRIAHAGARSAVAAKQAGTSGIAAHHYEMSREEPAAALPVGPGPCADFQAPQSMMLIRVSIAS